MPNAPDPAQNGKERRRFKRARASFIVTYLLREPVPVELQTHDNHFTAVAVDISVGGIGVIVNEPLPISVRIQIRFTLHNDRPGPDREMRRWFELSGKPLHCMLKPRAGYHAGIQFEKPPEEDIQFIREYIQNQELRAVNGKPG